MRSTDAGLSAAIDRGLRAATRAPSVHNTQPWLFVVSPPRIELYLDRERVLPVADPDAREAQLSCGAALFNLCLALRASDHGAHIDLLPDPDRPDLLGIVNVGDYRLASPELRSLATAIDRRATNRRPFDERPVPLLHRRILTDAARRRGAGLVLFDTEQLDTFVGLLRQADHAQEEDPGFQRELTAWTTGDPARHDGVPRWAGGPRPIGGASLKLRRYPGVRADERHEQEPLVVALTSPGDTVPDRLSAGQAMQRVLLTATTVGLSASFLSQPIEVPHVRAALRVMLGADPQTVLRIGYGHLAPPTPRRPLAAVTRYPVDATPAKEAT